MGPTVEADEVYGQLLNHYAQFGPIPRRKETLEILKLRFTPEEAALALAVPSGGLSAEDLARKLGRATEQVRQMAENMTRKGIFLAREKSGIEVFTLWDFTYSLYTPTYGDGVITDDKRRVAELREKLWQNGLSYLMFDSKYPLERVLPAEDYVDPSDQLAPYEKASDYALQSGSKICVVACGCCTSTNRCNRRVFRCIHFGDEETKYWVKYRGGRLLSEEEFRQLIRDAVREGFVLMGRNYQNIGRGFPTVICTCCPDDCLLLRSYKENHNPYAFAKSNFAPRIDTGKCTGCFTCLRKCPVGAIGRHLGHDGKTGDRTLVIEERCIGCGVCAAACPQDAIRLNRVRHEVPAPDIKEAMQRNLSARAW